MRALVPPQPSKNRHPSLGSKPSKSRLCVELGIGVLEHWQQEYAGVECTDVGLFGQPGHLASRRRPATTPTPRLRARLLRVGERSCVEVRVELLHIRRLGRCERQEATR